MNEADTRAEQIEPQLREAGWVNGGDVRVQREYSITKGEIRAGRIRPGKLKADYVLSYRNRKLAVIEAKSDRSYVGEGVAQAKRYAQKLGLETAYAANGKEIYEICLRSGKESLVTKFPTPQQLWEKTFPKKNEWIDEFNKVSFEENIGGAKETRYYQEIAINKAMEAIANDQQRVLLTLATGTGKTFIAFQIAWKLFKSRWTIQKDRRRTPRILFLADRNILADQAYSDFVAFSDDARVRINPREIGRKGEVPKNGSVFFTIFQTFMSGAEDKPYFGEYESDFFDFVIIDECHRGGASDESSWRDILNHFHAAVHLGLTATPKRDDNVDTYEYFGEPVYKYSLKEGIQDGFLTPFRIKRIQSTIDEYMRTPDDEVVEGRVEEGHVYTGGEFNTKIYIPARERKLVKEMLAGINKDEKTLVFCANQEHAAKVRELINEESDSPSNDYCVRVTADEGEIGDTFLKRFRDNEKLIPTILTTSRKLTTGVDARNVRNIVLLRRVNNMIEFKQIIGRGTRLFEGKYYFTIFDFFGAYRLFNDAEWDGEPLQPVDEGENDGKIRWEDGEPDNDEGGNGDEDKPTKVKIRLADGKERELQTWSSTYFFLDGKTISAEDFIKHLFDILHLPKFFESEEKLREIWANPTTRKELLAELEKEGCGRDDLAQLQKIIDAEKSDLFDVLEYISYARTPISRATRVERARENIYAFLNKDQREFIAFVLRNYVQEGIDELDDTKLGTVLRTKYGSMNDAQQKLGEIKQIRSVFIDFQRHLYKQAVG